MGLNGPLPDGLRFEVLLGVPAEEGRTVTCVAYLGEEMVGTLAVDTDQEIAAVDVEDGWRRRGIATAMLEHLLQVGYRVKHDWNNQFDDGRQWARAVDPDGHTRHLKEQAALTLSSINAPLEPAAPALVEEINALREQMAAAAQAEYDTWEQDEDGLDPELGSGGICDRIAEALSAVICETVADVDPGEYGFDGDEHAALVIRRGDEQVFVDIDHRLYETGGGYSWRKLDGVVFRAQDVTVEDLGPAFEVGR